MQPLISQGRITSAEGISWEARNSIGLPTAQRVKFLSLRNGNEVLEGGKLLLLASEPGSAARMSRLACRPGYQSQAGEPDAFHKFITYDPRSQGLGFFPHFATG